jgi:AGZA family xanthine/uracil permease-like MFS transporter
VALGNGFILTAMLWGGIVAFMMDRKLRTACLFILISAFLTFFGIIHSATPDGNMYLPWTLEGVAKQIPYQFTAAYLVLAIVIFMLSFTKESKEPLPEESH